MNALMSHGQKHELRCQVWGRVQGVMFRDFCQRQARGHRLTGWVKNNPDGTVSVCARGEKESLELYMQELQRGSMFSRVDTVESKWDSPRETSADFVILYE